MAMRLANFALRKCLTYKPFGSAGIHESARCVIGNREIVGFGVNGEPEYVDRPEYPFPAVRYKETTPDMIALREKEKGDWRKLTLDEKKTLYRANFCQTYSEFTHPNGELRASMGLGLFFTSFGVWLFIFYKLCVYDPLPESFSEENRSIQLRRMLDLKMNVFNGLASEWDYEKDMWK